MADEKDKIIFWGLFCYKFEVERIFKKYLSGFFLRADFLLSFKDSLERNNENFYERKIAIFSK